MDGIVYKYDLETGEYQGEYQCQVSPLEPGKYLDDVPNTLKTAPPATAANEVACAVEGEWVVKADYRGQVFYKPDGTIVEIKDIGVLPDQQWLTEPPPPTVQQQIDALKAEIDAIERADLMNRRAREAFILQAEKIAMDDYGLTPEQLYLVNPGYKGAKDVDAQCAALRAQISALEDQQ